MSKPEFRVEQIDHVEVFVPNRQEAAAWYAKTLGLEALTQHADWVAPGGPLMISSDGGRTMIALFEGTPQRAAPIIGWRRTAFRVSAGAFLRFLAHGPAQGVFDRDGQRLASLEVIDHQKSWSVYFCDPWGNALEVTCYEYAAVGAGLACTKPV